VCVRFEIGAVQILNFKLNFQFLVLVFSLSIFIFFQFISIFIFIVQLYFKVMSGTALQGHMEVLDTLPLGG
jgi:hypothetical protein